MFFLPPNQQLQSTEGRNSDELGFGIVEFKVTVGVMAVVRVSC